MATKRSKSSGNRRGGRHPVSFVMDPETEQPIDGLRYHKSSGRYYRIESNKRIHYKRNGLAGVAYLRRAIFEHQCWRTGTEPPTTEFIPITEPAHDQFGGEINPVATVDENGLLISGMYVPLHDIYKWVREQVMNPETRSDFAQAIGIPEIAHLDKLRPSGLSLSLDNIGSQYLDKQPPLHPRYKRDGTKFWKEFQTIAAVETVSELTAAVMKRYRETIYHNGSDKSPSYVNNRITLVVSIFRYAQTEGEDTDSLNAALVLCRMLRRMKKADVDPQPIERADFAKILAVADGKWRAMLLLALNAAYYPRHEGRGLRAVRRARHVEPMVGSASAHPRCPQGQEMTDRNPDTPSNGNRMLALLKSFGLSVSVERNRIGTYVLSATDQDRQK